MRSDELVSWSALQLVGRLAVLPPVDIWTDDCGRYWFRRPYSRVSVLTEYGPYLDLVTLLLALLQDELE